MSSIVRPMSISIPGISGILTEITDLIEISEEILQFMYISP